MNIYDIRFYIYQKLDINSLKICFQIDHLSQLINNDYFWEQYFQENNLKLPILNDNWFKSYHVSLKTNQIINDFKTNKIIFMELNNIVDNLFECQYNNVKLKNFKNIDRQFFYELRISASPDHYNFFCVMYECCYEGIERSYHSLDINFEHHELYNVIFKLFYYTVNSAYVYTY